MKKLILPVLVMFAVKAIGVPIAKLTTLVQLLKSVMVTLAGPAHKPETEEVVAPVDQRKV